MYVSCSVFLTCHVVICLLLLLLKKVCVFFFENLQNTSDRHIATNL